jgi:protein gp37
MGKETAISWTDSTWNPIRGCTVVSAGCKNCYAMDVAARFSGPGQPYEGLAYKDSHGHAHWTGEVREITKHLLDPLSWQKPLKIFVNSMSDLFHPNVTDEYTDKIFAVMALADRHIFQILTKRPERMLAYITDPDRQKNIILAAAQLITENPKLKGKEITLQWPLPNVWLGTSVEDQRAADERIPLLRDTPAAVRFLSCEPLLGPIRLSVGVISAGFPKHITRDGRAVGMPLNIHWIIVGGESGRYFREMNPDWARSLRDQCEVSRVAFWYKQGSGLRPGMDPTLDGIEYHQFPATA